MGIVKVLVVGGGGAGMGNKSTDWNSGDGGSAGQLIYNDNFTVNDGFYSVIVGAGSSGVNGPTIPSNGGNSSFSTITATGGTGGQYGSSSVARTGGRGAGGAGGGPYSSTNGGYAGYGGIGLSYDIDGTSKYYAGGGGGGFTVGGAGGSGVGGNGESYGQSNGSAGATNTGSGGGGRSNGTTSPGYNGGSGIVIIRYQTSLLTCYGGTKTIDGDYTVHTFTSSGTFLVGNFVGALIIGGGGAGMGNNTSNWNSGDGGSAGQLINTTFTLSGGTYPVIIGSGGSGVNGPTPGTNGGDSSFSTITATGGTGGQYGSSAVAPKGGNGAGGLGSNGFGDFAGSGGIGLSYNIDGTSKYYAGGGGGGFTVGGAGGSGVGGNGESYNQSNGSAGATNTGSGGGGRSNSTTSPGYAGGSGIVILRYPTGLIDADGGTKTIDGDYTIHTFTSSGNFIVKSVTLTFGEYLPTNNTSFLLHLNGSSFDSSSNNVNGTDNDIIYTNGRFSKCASFNGSTSYIDLGTGLSVNTPLTCVAWIKISNYSTNNLYLAKRDNTSGENCQYEFYTQVTSGKLTYFNGITEYPGNSQVPVNEWICVITTLSSSTNGILKHYINGKLDSTTNNVSIGSGISTLPVHIGDAGGNSTSTDHFNGMIDEIIFENIDWSTEKIKKYYTYTKGRFGNL